MTTTLRLNSNDLTENILNAIKLAFKNKEIEINITEVQDETEYLLATEANKNHLLKSIEDIDKGNGIRFSVNDFLEKYNVK